MLTVGDVGNSASAFLYFGSPNPKETAHAVGGGQIMISTQSEQVSFHIPEFSTDFRQSINLGITLLGGAMNAKRIGVTVTGNGDFHAPISVSDLEVVTV